MSSGAEQNTSIEITSIDKACVEIVSMTTVIRNMGPRERIWGLGRLCLGSGEYYMFNKQMRDTSDMQAL